MIEEPLPIFVLGAALIASGIWCGMFVAPRHGLGVLFASIVLAITGWLVIAFADVVNRIL